MIQTTDPPSTPITRADVIVGDGVERQEAIRQIQRRRRFWMNLVVSSLVMLVVTAVWAVTEYNNAGGWPTDGFSQSSSIPNVWNIWIIYPFLGWVCFVVVDAVATFVRRPISEADIRREIDRQRR